ncbi:indole-3-pyruvate monooxygenase YUCCA8 [Cocos nucifera]|uniref:Flavin-containing monooxygenase n=1 Tax=Cocos nucifera TaxID=13894 RepID=A0A8K0IHC0_COCNU|nr:indole-3-pyruvate monooxygenase YUCCA8 [Cocos nucifera]
MSGRIPPPPPTVTADPLSTANISIRRVVKTHSPIIVGAGPSGLAVAASLHRLSVPSIILERSDGIADLWRHRAYGRLFLHLPKAFCQLPHLPFPAHFPTYPSKADFLQYLHSYAHHFSLHPIFGCTVVAAHFDPAVSLWRVTTVWHHLSDQPVQSHSPSQMSESLSESSRSTSEESVGSSAEPEELEVVEYVSPWLVVASGENAEPVVPKLKGREEFKGSVLHSSEYKNGKAYMGKRVLVVGCGNSGMDLCLDLCEHGAMSFMSVRSGVSSPSTPPIVWFSSLDCPELRGWKNNDLFSDYDLLLLSCIVHVLPREMFGASTFGLAMKLLKWLPLRMVDMFLLMVVRMVIGNTEKYRLKRPELGPLEIKIMTGKTPVLDVGALTLIKNGRIQIVPEVESLTSNGAKFVDGREMGYDSVVFATGYRSNVATWLKDSDFISEDGKPKTPFPHGWKGKNEIFYVGFTGRGLPGTSADAIKIALDIAESWKKKNPESQNFVL